MRFTADETEVLKSYASHPAVMKHLCEKNKEPNARGKMVYKKGTVKEAGEELTAQLFKHYGLLQEKDEDNEQF